jgi:hypothetical protein
MPMWLQLMSHVNFHAFLNNFTKSLYLIYSLPISLFHLLDYFKWLVFLTEYAMYLISAIFFLNFHTIITASSTFNMKSYSAPRGLTLHAGTILFEADDTLEQKSFIFKFVHPHWSFWRNYGSWNPTGTA